MRPGTPGYDIAVANLSPDAAVTHGATRFLSRAIAPPCSKCLAKGECDRYQDGQTCVVAEEYQAEVTAQIMALPHLQPEDRPLASEYAKQATALAIIDHYLAHAGPFLPGAEAGLVEAQPVLKLRTTISMVLVRLASELGLSPAARARLKTGGPGHSPGSELARAIAELTAQEAERRRAGALDAGFEEVTDSHGGRIDVEEERD